MTAPTLPEWPQRTVAVLSMLGGDGIHAIPVSAPVRAGDARILLALHHTRDSLARIAQRPEVALTFLAEDDLAFTVRGRARIVEDRMAVDAEYVAVAIDVTAIDDHRQPQFRVTASVGREWIDDDARVQLGARVKALSGSDR